MKTSTRRFLVALAICMLLPIATTSAKDQVTRPFKMSAHSQMVVDLTSCDPMYAPFGCAYVAHAEGVATHMGQVTAYEAGIVAPMTWGVMTAANGDELFYDFNSMSSVVTITGGTGRFEGATGEIILETELVSSVFDPVEMTITNTLVWTGSGTLTY
jgi:hypothetical protein